MTADYGMVPCEGTGWWADFGICRMCGKHVETEDSMAVRHTRRDIERSPELWTDEGFEGTTVEPTFPVYCPHGRQVGWALRNEPTTVTDTRFCAPCHECLSPNDGSGSP